MNVTLSESQVMSEMSGDITSHPEFDEISISSDKNPIFKSIKLRESKATEVIEDELIEEIQPQIRETIDAEEQQFERRIAAKIVQKEIDTPTATRVLWVDESEPYFLCEGCFENNQDKAWEGDRRHPQYIEFQHKVHTQLRDGCLCEYCREVEIQQVMSVIHSTIELQMDGESTS